MAECHGKTRDIFLGGNTGNGFTSFYGQVVTEETKHLYILKGGPGTGKSTFIMQAGEEIRRRGFPVEFAHCSSDNNSLDGVVFPSLGIAMVDGTTPHAVDPRYPGAVDEILNFGVYWDKKGIKNQTKTILELTRTGGLYFSKAYAYLKAAAVIHREWSRANRRLAEEEQLRAITEEIQNEIRRRTRTRMEKQLHDPNQRAHTHIGKGTFRRLFASAITPDGLVHYLESIFQDAQLLYLLEGPPGCGQERIINSLLWTAEEKKLTVEIFYCALCPEKIDHLWFPDLEVGVVSSTPPHQYPASKDARMLNLETIPAAKNSFLTEAEEAQPVLAGLIEKAVAWLRRAKTVHDELEDCYRPYMNFPALDGLKAKILAEVLSYC